MKNLGITLKTARTKIGITQQELADRVGKTATYISIIERNEQTPSHDLLNAICEIVEMPYPALVIQATDISEVPEVNRPAFEALKAVTVALIKSMYQ